MKQEVSGFPLKHTAASCGWDFTRATAQVDGAFTQPHSFFSNLFLDGFDSDWPAGDTEGVGTMGTRLFVDQTETSCHVDWFWTEDTSDEGRPRSDSFFSVHL
ncbi:hypothetical protein INR49_028196 [Caranx melampygus]|nr:hypothetical protein INR49_028196 [Caranx melampygus]